MPSGSRGGYFRKSGSNGLSPPKVSGAAPLIADLLLRRSGSDADAGHRHLPEQVWGNNRRGWIGQEFLPEFRMRECSAEVSGRRPDCVIEISRAFADRPVKPGGDEAGLALHEDRVVLPGFEKVCSSALSTVNTFTSRC